MPLCDGLKVVRSAIHGYGVIATRPFAAGDVLLQGEGVVYRDEDEFDDTYCLVFDGDVLQPPTDEQIFYDLTCQSRWINHSCEPNTQVDSGWDAKLAHPIAWWIATRNIEVGEELTYDYAFTAEVAEPCGCGAKTCRGLIVDQDEIPNLTPAQQTQLRR